MYNNIVLEAMFNILENKRRDDDTSPVHNPLLNITCKYVTDFLPYRFEKNGECLFTFWTLEELLKKFDEKV